MNRLVRSFAGVVALVFTGVLGSTGVWAQESRPAPLASEAQNAIEALDVTQKGGGAVVRVTLREPLKTPPPSFSIPQSGRVVFDLPLTQSSLERNNQGFEEGMLRSLNVVPTEERTRLVFALSGPVHYETRLEERALYISFQPRAEAGKGAAPLFGEKKAAINAQDAERFEVRDLNFRRGKDGEARILIDLSDSAAPVDIRQQGPLLLVTLANTQLPDALRRRLDVLDFATPVATVTAQQQGKDVQVAIAPKGLWEHSAYQSESQFVVEVRPVLENPNKLVQGSRTGYQGEKLSLNFQNVDVRRLLQVIGEFTGLNIVVSDTVGGAITLILRDVPWDQALDIVLQQKGLDMRKNGNVILVAPREELAAKEKLELESKQQIGDLEPLRTESFQLNYQKAEAVQKLLTDSQQRMLSKRGSAVVDVRTNILFVQDTAARLDEVRSVLSKVDVQVRQVLIEARIVEASDSFSRNLGARLGIVDLKGAQGNTGMIGGQLSTNAYMSGQQSTQPSFSESLGVNLPAGAIRNTPAGAMSFTLFGSNRGRFLNLELSALEADGRGKIISSPRVVTADQIEAVIEQGKEIPYLQASSSGATNIAYKKAVLSLKVKPQITPDGKVTMLVTVNKDAPDPTIPTGAGLAIDTKHVKTEVLVENGGTVVIGGIYTQETRNRTNKIPVLGDVPLLGHLFKQNERLDDKSELLVFITPRIINDNLSLR